MSNPHDRDRDRLQRGRGVRHEAPDAAAIDVTYRRLVRAFRELDPDGAANLFVRDALYVTADGVVLRGAEEILNWFVQLFEHARQTGGRFCLSIQPAERAAGDGEVYDRGDFVLASVTPRGERRVRLGRFMVLLRPAGGDGVPYRISRLNSMEPVASA